ncbi:hypothetical protein E2C01_049651 [Portunus trituberculatus]|uniref:Uncharacterized protein n=1 Tax=Portunus trituberculatus TaxID=210409 RepID=A0A5B7GEF7_PORTR|nr:hypothetical protein [Portunus trituberculatus]
MCNPVVRLVATYSCLAGQVVELAKHVSGPHGGWECECLAVVGRSAYLDVSAVLRAFPVAATPVQLDHVLVMRPHFRHSTIPTIKDLVLNVNPYSHLERK